MPHINIILQMNAGGLRQDAQITRGALIASGNQVTVTTISRVRPRPLMLAVRALQPAGPRLYGWVKSAPRYDINLFLEHVWPNWLPTARRNCFVPNPEWFRESCESSLNRLDLVLCKTRYTQTVFEKLAARTKFTSFTSLDRWNGAPAKSNGRLLHMACGNSQKGTKALIEAWRRHPEWPPLQIVNAPRRLLPIEEGPNLLHIGRVSEDELLRMQNGCDIHLCPSEAEGWGHSIVESASVGAVVLTTDAPPMNELIRPGRGVLVTHRGTEALRRGMKYFPDPEDLTRKVEQVIAMPQEKRRSLGEQARIWFDQNDKFFRAQLNEVVHSL